MAECVEYVARAELEEGGLFAHQSEHASFQIVTPTATVRLSHGRLHQLAMRDPTDQYDLPDHLTWQMNMAVDHTDVSQNARRPLGPFFALSPGKIVLVVAKNGSTCRSDSRRWDSNTGGISQFRTLLFRPTFNRPHPHDVCR